MKSIAEAFADITGQIISNSTRAGRIGPENVYQSANLLNRRLINRIVGGLILPGSAIIRPETFIELGELAHKGKSCLILMEHYSNFDIPVFYYLMEKAGSRCADVVEQVISMAGIKLSEESDFARSYSEAYPRIVIYPSRSIDPLREKAETGEELARARAINRAALHEMIRYKHAGHIILVFPTGTRYRPGHPETKRGLKEMDSYIKSFDHVLFVGTAGNALRIAEDGVMSGDYPVQDLLLYVPGKILDAQKFREEARAHSVDGDNETRKQVCADAIMSELDVLHVEAEKIRADLVAASKS